MDFLFCLLYLVIVFIFELEYLPKLIYMVQMSGYTYTSIRDCLYSVLKHTYVQWLLYLIVFIALLVIAYTNIYFLTMLMILSGGVIISTGEKFVYVKKVKYTNRMIRLSVIIILLLVLYLTITLFLDYLLIVAMMPFVLIVNYLIVLLGLVIMSPLEYSIRQSYIRQAKLKLSESSNLIKIGITGSYGKTSTKEILSTILSTHYNTVSTPKSYNTPMGITKTILGSVNNLSEVFVCEMGAKKVGEIKELCSIVDVDYGIVTAVGRQHTSTFGNINNIYRTKKELPDYLTGKACIFNISNKYVFNMYRDYIGNKIAVFYLKNKTLHINGVLVKKMHKYARKYINIDNKCEYYIYPSKNSVYAKHIKLGENGCVFTVYKDREKLFNVSTTLVGEHNIINILLSIAMAKLIGVSNKNIEIGLEKLKPIKARLERLSADGGATILNNGYNSNIDSVDSALGAIALFDRRHTLVITPGFIETSAPYDDNFLLGQKIAKVATDIIIVKAINREAILSGLKSMNFDMDRVMFAGSFAEIKDYVNSLDKDYVVLIENDLPDNYI